MLPILQTKKNSQRSDLVQLEMMKDQRAIKSSVILRIWHSSEEEILIEWCAALIHSYWESLFEDIEAEKVWTALSMFNEND